MCEAVNELFADQINILKAENDALKAENDNNKAEIKKLLTIIAALQAKVAQQSSD